MRRRCGQGGETCGRDRLRRPGASISRHTGKVDAGSLGGLDKTAQSGPTIPWGPRDMSWLYWLFILILLAGSRRARLFGLPHVRHGGESTPASTSAAGCSGRTPEPRLGVIEQATVDARRRLVLIRRDGVEHLIMTGGPVDVVIETGIQAPQSPSLPSRLRAGRAVRPRLHAPAAQLRPSRQRMIRARISGVSVSVLLVALLVAIAVARCPRAAQAPAQPAPPTRQVQPAEAQAGLRRPAKPPLCRATSPPASRG